MKSHLDLVKELYRAEKYGDALSALEETERSGFVHPAILVWKSRCLQLIDDHSTVELSQIEALLKESLQLDDEYLPAIIDLAYFYLRVMDDASQAAPLFQKALGLCVENATEVVVGIAECISETDSNTAALEFLAKHNSLEIETEPLDALRAELQ
jgi:hypothetical protein